MTWFENKVHELDDPDAPVTPSRVIGTAFQPSTTKHVLCLYTIEMTVAHGESSVVTLNSDAVATPTTARTSAKGALTDDAASMVVRQQIVYLCPPGHYVKLVASGSPAQAATIVQQVELAQN